MLPPVISTAPCCHAVFSILSYFDFHMKTVSLLIRSLAQVQECASRYRAAGCGSALSHDPIVFSDLASSGWPQESSILLIISDSTGADFADERLQFLNRI
jgi:hypothetical protein